MTVPTKFMLAASAVAIALSPLAAGAQTQPPPSTAAPATAPAAKTAVTDQQITQAAVAMQKVMSIRQAYNQKLTQAKPEDRGRIADESQTAMKKAVTDSGLSVEQYNAILQLAQNDLKLAAGVVFLLGFADAQDGDDTMA